MPWLYNPYTHRNVACVIANDGIPVPVDSLPQTIAYSSGQISTITVTYGGVNYVQTYTYTSGVLTGISQWVNSAYSGTPFPTPNNTITGT